MRYSFDTYRLYNEEGRFAWTIRVRVAMKEAVDGLVLESAVNTAILRYPYFAVRVMVDDEGGFAFEHNPRPVAVLPLSERVRNFCSPEVNGHLLFVEYEGKDIYFNISHSMCGGRGAFPWVMTNVYQYVKEKYHVEPHAPGIRKPGEDLLPGEATEPDMSMLLSEPPVYESVSKNPAVLGIDYMHGLYNPFMRDPNYEVFAFRQKDIMRFAKENDASVASFFLVVTAKALDKVLPESVRVIGGEIAHNPGADIGIPNSHCDLLSHAYLDYERDKLKWDMERLGTMTRGQIILQTDPTVSKQELRRKLELYESLDQIKGHKDKLKYMKENNFDQGKNARHGTYIVNYTGKMDWGEVADYVEYYAAIVEGHLLLEVTSMSNRIFVSFMQLLSDEKYRDAFREVLDELGVPYRVKGPFPKHLPKHDLPGKDGKKFWLRR